MIRIALMTLLASMPAVVAAQYRPLETHDEARQRRDAERYDATRRGHEPLGGHGDRLGTPAPIGSTRAFDPYEDRVRGRGADDDRRSRTFERDDDLRSRHRR